MSGRKKKSPSKRKAPTEGTGKAASATARETDSTSRQPSEEPMRSGSNAIPIVGIGASAGGLEAFKQFLCAMPSDSGAALVLVQHLDPNHESMMADLLGKYTPMPVCQAEHGQRPQPNRVYLIPPNHYLELNGGLLNLCAPVKHRGMRLPIDHFFRSLAEECRERAIGVILSGTGSDGTAGLKAIKAEGGMIMVESPKSAGYDGMPRAALNTGLVDFVRTVDELPEALVRYLRHPYVAEGEDSRLVDGAPADHLKAILSLLQSRTGYDFRPYKKGTLTRRIERRLGLHQLENLGDYVELLRSDAEERHHLFRDLLIGVTSFFRDEETWDALEREVLPELLNRKEADEPIRIWVPGCSSGEETYSIAMLLFDAVKAGQNHHAKQIFATDIDETTIEQARTGRYPQSIAGDLSVERLGRFFDEDGDFFVVKKNLRDSVVFALQNLISDPPFSNLDLICCRNLLIYLESPIQQRIMQMFNASLADEGYLVLGSSESIGKQQDLFQPVAKNSQIYRKSGKVPQGRTNFPILPGQARDVSHRDTSGRPNQAPDGGVADVARTALLEHFAPAAVLINRNYQALFFHGPTSLYLRVPPGEPTRDVSEMCFEGLRAKLRAAVHQAAASRQTSTCVARHVKRHGDVVAVRVTARPLEVPAQLQELFLLSFEEEQRAKPPSEGTRDAPSGEQAELVSQLEYELQATREDLQSTIEELETSNEELKASNEEVMSMNEELQSTNEELETSREELQSLNEELNTVNSQLGDKVREVEASNNDLTNLINSTDIATLFLDTELRIRRFTPATSELVSLLATDVGRPFRDIAPRFTDDRLLDDSRKVLEKLTPREREIRNDDAHSYLRRIVPYRTQDNRIEGVVITFTDVTPVREQADELRQRERQQAAVAHLGRVALRHTSLSSLFDQACREIHEVLGVSHSTMLERQPETGHLLLLAGTGWNDSVVPGESTVEGGRSSQAGFTLESSAPVIVDDLAAETRFSGPQLLHDHGVVSGLSVIIGPEAEPWGVLAAHTTETRSFKGDDVNFLESVANVLFESIQRHRLEEELRELNQNLERNVQERAHELRVLSENVPAYFAYLDRDLRYRFVNRMYEEKFRRSHEEFLGRRFDAILQPNRGAEVEARMRRALAGEEQVFEETVDIPRDGVRVVRGRYVPRREPDGSVSGIFVLADDITAERRLQQEVLDAAEREKERIGRDLHDSICQELGGIGLFGKALAESLRRQGSEESEEAEALIEQLEEVTQKARKLAHGLSPVVLEGRTLGEALGALAEIITDLHDEVACDLRNELDNVDLSESVSTQLYFIAREAAFNAIRHGRTSHIRITLRRDRSRFLLDVCDNGGGRADQVEEGLGIRSMRYRARTLGGDLVLRDNKEQPGLAVRCRIPLSSEEIAPTP